MFLKTNMKVEWIQYLYDLKKMKSSGQRCIKKCLLYCFLDTAKKNQGGANYYQQFRKDFIKPDGPAHSEESFKDTTLVKRLKSFNCEFVMRPRVGLSEFSKTVMENAKYVRENLEIFNIEVIQRFLNKADNIVQSLLLVNQKDKSGTGKIFSSQCI